jgi:hypothetical protein
MLNPSYAARLKAEPRVTQKIARPLSSKNGMPACRQAGFSLIRFFFNPHPEIFRILSQMADL